MCDAVWSCAGVAARAENVGHAGGECMVTAGSRSRNLSRRQAGWPRTAAKLGFMSCSSSLLQNCTLHQVQSCYSVVTVTKP